MNPPEDRPGFPTPPPPEALEPPPSLPPVVSDAASLPRVPWRWWEPIVVFLFTFVSSGILGGLVGWLVARGADCTDPIAAVRGRCDIASSLVIAIFELSLGAWAIVWVKIRWNAGPGILGLTSRRFGSDLRVGLVAGIAGFVAGPVIVAAIFQAITNAISDTPVEAPQQLPFEGTPHALALVITGLSVVLLAPVCEELFFRGFLYQALRRRLPIVVAGIVSALIFGAAHVQPPLGLGLLLLIPAISALGLILAWAFERRASLVPSIAAHALFNLIGYGIYLGGVLGD